MKIILAFVMAISLPVTLCSTAFASSKDSDPIILTTDQFSELVLTGNVIKPVLSSTKNASRTAYDIALSINSKNQLFWISTDSLIVDENESLHPIKALQPAHIIDGILLIVDYARELSPNTHKLRVTNGVDNLIEMVWIRQFYVTGDTVTIFKYPRFPIVFRTSEAEDLSLLHLTYVFNSASAELIAQGQARKLNAESFKFLTNELMQVPDRIPQDFCELIKVINKEPKWKLDNDPRAFTLDKEKLFYTVKRLYEAHGDFNYQSFFKEILKIDKKLTEVYNSATTNSVKKVNKQRAAKIKQILSQKQNIEQRYNMAKALLLDVFYYVEEPLFDTSTNIKLTIRDVSAVLYTKYGQMARLVEHMQPHVKSENEKIPLVPGKSLFVLRSDVKIEELYKALCNSIIDDVFIIGGSKQPNKAYEVDDVTVTDWTGHEDKSTITITITPTGENIKKLMKKMLSTDGMGNIDSTSQIICVLHEEGGSFDLKTIYPTKGKKGISNIHEDKEAIYKLYDTTFLPDRLQLKNRYGTRILGRIES